MENLTSLNETTTYFHFRPGIWINDLVISSILVVVTLYLVVALLFHQIKVEKPRKEGFLQLPQEKRYGVLSKYTCILIGFASLTRLVNSITVLVVEGSTVYSNATKFQTVSADAVCDILPPIGNIALSVGGGLVFLFLWFRQRVFYVHSSLKVLNNKCVSVFSFAVIIVWILAWISLCTAYFVQVRYRFDKDGGCLIALGTDIPYGQIAISWTAVSILMQIALLGLFINPILKRALWRDQKQKERNSRLMRRVKKAIVLASICLGTDIFSVAVLILIYEENTNSAIFMYSVNLVINHFATIACFDHWKKLLWPWSSTCHKISTSFEVKVHATSLISVSSSQQQSKTTNVTKQTSMTDRLSSAN